MTRKRKHSGGRPRRPASPPVPACESNWVNVDGRRMFVVGYTPGGAPYGVFEDEMDGVGEHDERPDDPLF